MDKRYYKFERWGGIVDLDPVLKIGELIQVEDLNCYLLHIYFKAFNPLEITIPEKREIAEKERNNLINAWMEYNGRTSQKSN